MILVTILLGLLGFGVVVFPHELGHFLMAKLVGIEVEEFSLGWGPKLVSTKRGGTVYKISAFPIGGYCKMKGEESYRKALEQGLDDFPAEEGAYFTASPWKRVLVSLGGPLFNVAFAVVVAVFVAGVGYSVDTWSNRVILASDYGEVSAAAAAAGIRTGDRIVAIDGVPVSTFTEVQNVVYESANRDLALVLERDGQALATVARPLLDKESGSGRLGVYPWIDLVVDSVTPEGAAIVAGLAPGDEIVAVDGTPVANTFAFEDYLKTRRPEIAALTVLRGGVQTEVALRLPADARETGDIGAAWKRSTLEIKSDGLADAVRDGLAETWKTVASTYRGLASLFTGVDIFKSLSGPARITWIVGSVAQSGFSSGSPNGLVVALNFLSFLSIGLAVMNLLPIPLLDGGSIVLSLVEAARRKALKVKTVMRYQSIGMVIVAALFLLATVGDVIFFAGR